MNKCRSISDNDPKQLESVVLGQTEIGVTEIVAVARYIA